MAVPAWRRFFIPPGAGEADLLAFALPDLAVPLSTAAAMLAWRGSSWRVMAARATFGGVAYAAAYCVLWAMLRDGGWLSVVAMVPAAVLCALAAADATPVALLRRARHAVHATNLAKAFLQTTGRPGNRFMPRRSCGANARFGRTRPCAAR